MQVDKLKVELHPHQVECVGRGLSTQSLLIADDMGLGKTVEALAIAAVDFQQNRATRILIVTPATLKWNWFDEIEKLTTFHARVLDGSKPRRLAELGRWADGDDADILIVNYEQVKGHLDDLNDLNFDIVIFDEAHYIKNPRSKRTKACHRLRARRFFPMTGTPMLNRVDELWSLLHVAAPRDFPNYWKFRTRYCQMGGFQGKQVVGTLNEKELIEKLSKVMIRREKHEVLDLPDKVRTPIHVVMPKSQRELYDDILHKWRYETPDNPSGLEVENAMVQLLRLKQVCSSPYNLTENPEDKSVKVEVATERCVELWASKRPSVVFTQFRGTQKQMGQAALKAGIPAFGIHGGMSADARREQIRRWRTDGGAFVAMLQVGSQGLTLTEADTVIFLDKLWTPGLNTQAEDRLHRIGQTETVNVIDIQARDTIETRIEQILASKSKLADLIVGGAAEWKAQLIKEMKK